MNAIFSTQRHGGSTPVLASLGGSQGELRYLAQIPYLGRGSSAASFWKVPASPQGPCIAGRLGFDELILYSDNFCFVWRMLCVLCCNAFGLAQRKAASSNSGSFVRSPGQQPPFFIEIFSCMEFSIMSLISSPVRNIDAQFAKG